MDEGVKGFLHLWGAGVELVQKEHVGFLSGDGPGRTEDAVSIPDLWNADDVLGGQLAAQKRDAVQSQAVRKFLDDGGLIRPGPPR